jgi:hypothetical protein
VRELGQRGITADQLVAAGAKLIQANNVTEVALRGSSKAGTLQQRALNRAAMAALRRRDFDALERVMGRAQTAFAALDVDTQAHLGALFADALASYGLRGSDWVTLMKLLCLSLQDLSGNLSGKGCGRGN